MQIVEFDINGGKYAVDILHIKEIINPTEVTVVPNSAQYVKGIINFRGEVITVVDIYKLLQLEQEVGPESKMIVYLLEDKTVAFEVDKMHGTKLVDDATIEKAEVLSTLENKRNYSGVINDGETITLLLDIKGMLIE